MVKRAIIHVENTEGVVDFARYLSEAGWTILTANKTEELLKAEKIPVIREQALVESNYHLNETSSLMRQILLTKYNKEEKFISTDNDETNIYVICVNITPVMNVNITSSKYNQQILPSNFFITSLLRNTFSNHENVLILTDPEDYKEAIIQLKTDNISKEFRTYLAAKALNLISAFDAGLSASILQGQQYNVQFMNYLMYPYKKNMALHEGSNSQQKSFLYKSPTESGALNGFLKLQGKELTHNIICDISFAWERISTLYAILKNQYTVKSTNSDGYDFTTQFTPLTGTVFTIAVKFNTIVGAALSTNVLDSFSKAYEYDTYNIKDVVVACSSVIDAAAATEMVKGNFAAIVAPSFTMEAKQILSSNRNIRLVPSAKVATTNLDGRLVNGGLLLQTKDNSLFEHWHVRTKNRPSQFKTDEMAFGMLLLIGARSYSAVLLKDNSLIGIGQGCTSTNRALTVTLQDARERVERKKTSGEAVNNENPDLANPIGDVLICDSTIQFDEPVKKLIDSGITAIIQTGGTPADNEFINYCDERGVVMVFTGMTHISF